MNPARTLLRSIWRAWFFVNFSITLILLYPLFFVLLQKEEWFHRVHKLKRFWARLILFNSGISYQIHYEEKLNPANTYIYCPNHSSYLDVVLSYVTFPNYFHYIAKLELSKAPLFGIFFKKMDIAFDRSSLKESHKAFKRASNNLRKGTSLAIFPEGTIGPQSPKLSRFKNGPFKLAIENQVAIVPITFLNNWLILPDRAAEGGCPGKAKIIVHKPIPTKGVGLNELDSLRDKTYRTIENALNHEG